MKIRCLKCKAVSPYQNGPDSTEAITCGECGARAFPVRRDDAGGSLEDLEATGTELAEVSRIDPASANSVLLGLMTLHQAQALQDKIGGGPTRKREPVAGPAVDVPVVPLPRSEETKGLSSRAAAVVAVLAILAALGIGSQGLRHWQNRAAPAERTSLTSSVQPEVATSAIESYRIERDETGHVTWVSAPTPEAVLVAYCEDMTTYGEHCDPVEVATTRPDKSGTRLGLLRLLTDVTEDYAITILENPVTGRWTAGSGEGALMPYVVVPQRIGDHRRPVSAERSRS